ncbi:MAG: hypothetical protein SNI58_05030 [Rikenellaceae bacterium]
MAHILFCACRTHLDASNIIAIVDIAVTLLLGFGIGYILVNRQHNSRASKDYFIGSITDFHKEYEFFLMKLSYGQTSAKDIKTFFKKFSMYLSWMRKTLKSNYSINCDKAYSANSELYIFVTGTDEFNEQHEMEFVKLRHSTISTMITHMEVVRSEIADIIISINKK